MNTISQSQIKTWRRCQKQWQFRYIHKLRIRHASRALQFGSLMHQCLAEHYRKKDAIALLETLAKNDARYGHDQEIQHLYEAVESNFIEYLSYWGDEEFEIETVEKQFELALSIDKQEYIFNGFIDLVVSDSGGYWLVEHKTGKSDSGEMMRYHDLQSALYHKAWNELHPDKPLKGTMWNYVTSYPLQPPKLLQSGKPSKAANQRTTPGLYEQTCEQCGVDVRDYAHVIENLENKMSSYFSRITLPADPDLSETLFRELKISVKEIDTARNDPDKTYVRTMDRHCAWCEFESLCHLELLTGEFEHAIRPDYKKIE